MMTGLKKIVKGIENPLAIPLYYSDNLRLPLKIGDFPEAAILQ